MKEFQSASSDDKGDASTAIFTMQLEMLVFSVVNFICDSSISVYSIIETYPSFNLYETPMFYKPYNWMSCATEPMYMEIMDTHRA